jgi:hypothetical protein
MAACFFWIAMVLTLACIAVVVSRDSELIWPWEARDFPLSGVLAGAAALAFLATELCHSLSSEPKEQGSQPVLPAREDQTGKLSKQEFMISMEEEFDRLDPDKRGELDIQEVLAGKLAGRLAPDRRKAEQQREPDAAGRRS